MTDPTNPKRDQSSEPSSAPELDFDVEMIRDLDVTDDSADAVRAGSTHCCPDGYSTPIKPS